MKEKRQSPRVDKTLPVKLSDPNFDILTETKNVSDSGAYCAVSQHIEPMTKLNLILLLPFKKGKTKEIKKVSCSGVVVRCEHTADTNKYPYRIGVYFNGLKDPDKKLLRSYVATAMKGK